MGSKGVLSVTKQGDRAIIDGEVSFSYKDPYDFSPDSENFWDKEMIRLENAGYAKTYMVQSQWTQKVHGVADIQNGELKNIRLQWKDQ